MNKRQAIALYAQELAQIFDLPLAKAREMAHKVWPDVKRVETGVKGERWYHITPKRGATMWGGLQSGDTNAQFHTGLHGVVQTTTIIGMCAVLALRGAPGHMLTKIEPDVHFKAAIPLGATVVMSVRVVPSNSRKPSIVILEIRGWLLESGVEIFDTRTLTMRRIPKRRKE